MKHLIKSSTVILCLMTSIICHSQTIIKMENDGGVYKIPCVINGLKLKLIFDTGASNVCISGAVASMMLENDYISQNDIKGTSQSQVADGRIVDNTIINIKRLEIGGKVLNNVNAVVIHGQTAPLLLGQSALKKLGRYSISGNNLIFEDDNNYGNSKSNQLTDEQIDKMINEAFNYYDKDSYYLALEKFELLYNLNELNSYGKMLYADCFYYTEKFEEALNIYISIQKDIEINYPKNAYWVYLQLGLCYSKIADYSSAMLYYEKLKEVTVPYSYFHYRAVEEISGTHRDMGNKYKALRMVTEYIDGYLKHKGMHATDCWNNGKHDKILAGLFFCSYLYSDSYENSKIYLILSAAWGNDLAIEICNELNLNYRVKPNYTRGR